MTEVHNPPPPMLTWTCVEVGEKGADDRWGDARFKVICRDGCQQNEIKEVTPELIDVCLGSTVDDPRGKGRKGKAKGPPRVKGEPVDRAKLERDRQQRADVEVVGFFRELFEVTEEQVKLENSSKKVKDLVVSGLNRDKRGLLWFLQAKTGKKFEAHWSIEFANAQARASSEASLKRKREMDDYEAAKAEILQESSSIQQPLLSARGNTKSIFSSTSSGKGAGVNKFSKHESKAIAKDAEEPSSEANRAQNTLSKDEPLEKTEASAVAAGSLGGLIAKYDSDSSEEEEEPVQLANPFSDAV